MAPLGLTQDTAVLNSLVNWQSMRAMEFGIDFYGEPSGAKTLHIKFLKPVLAEISWVNCIHKLWYLSRGLFLISWRQDNKIRDVEVLRFFSKEKKYSKHLNNH